MDERAEPSDILESGAEHSAGEPRRSFLHKAAAVVIGTIAIVIPSAAGLLVFTDPLRRKRAAAAFIPVVPLDAVPADGTPRKFRLAVDKVDAWNRSRDVKSIYLCRDKESGKLTCFSDSCPHAGCAVEWSQGGTFKCPCHNSAFNRDGSLVPGSVSPRGLDELEIDREALDEGMVKVKYVEFLAGMHDKKVKA